jgi:hypothetical protein
MNNFNREGDPIRKLRIGTYRSYVDLETYVSINDNGRIDITSNENDEKFLVDYLKRHNIEYDIIEYPEPRNGMVTTVRYYGSPKSLKELILDIFDTGDQEANEEMIQNIKINESMKKRVFESDWKQPNDESKMAKMQMKSILANAQEILDNIDVADNLDAWVQSSLTLADDYLESVKKYLLYGEDDVTVLEPIPVTGEEEPDTAPMENEPMMPSIADYPDQEGEEVPEEMPGEEGEEMEELPGDEDWNEEELDGEDLPTEETPEETPEEPEEGLEFPSEEEQEEDEITFDDIDFYNDEESEAEREEIENDFKEVDDEVEDTGEDDEDEDDIDTDMDESFYPKRMFARSVKDRIK